MIELTILVVVILCVITVFFIIHISPSTKDFLPDSSPPPTIRSWRKRRVTQPHSDFDKLCQDFEKINQDGRKAFPWRVQPSLDIGKQMKEHCDVDVGDSIDIEYCSDERGKFLIIRPIKK
jgi:hypothetical protein